MKKAARASLRAAFVNDCRLPGSAAAYTIDEQRKGFMLGQRKKRRLPPTAPAAGRSKRYNRVVPRGKCRLARLRHADFVERCPFSEVLPEDICSGGVLLILDPQRTRAGVSLIHLCVGANPYIGSRGVFDDRQALAGRPGRGLST